MKTSELLSIDLEFTPGRPARASLHLRGALRLDGILVWRTSRGPRVLFPVSGDRAPRPIFDLAPSVKREWVEAILASWRRHVRDPFGSDSATVVRRRAA